VRLEGLGQLKKSTSSGTRTSDLLACSIVPQPTMPEHTVANLYWNCTRIQFYFFETVFCLLQGYILKLIAMEEGGSGTVLECCYLWQ
jgi:hypothetical protein